MRNKFPVFQIGCSVLDHLTSLSNKVAGRLLAEHFRLAAAPTNATFLTDRVYFDRPHYRSQLFYRDIRTMYECDKRPDVFMLHVIDRDSGKHTLESYKCYDQALLAEIRALLHRAITDKHGLLRERNWRASSSSPRPGKTVSFDPSFVEVGPSTSDRNSVGLPNQVRCRPMSCDRYSSRRVAFEHTDMHSPHPPAYSTQSSPGPARSSSTLNLTNHASWCQSPHMQGKGPVSWTELKNPSKCPHNAQVVHENKYDRYDLEDGGLFSPPPNCLGSRDHDWVLCKRKLVSSNSGEKLTSRIVDNTVDFIGENCISLCTRPTSSEQVAATYTNSKACQVDVTEQLVHHTFNEACQQTPEIPQHTVTKLTKPIVRSEDSWSVGCSTTTVHSVLVHRPTFMTIKIIPHNRGMHQSAESVVHHHAFAEADEEQLQGVGILREGPRRNSDRRMVYRNPTYLDQHEARGPKGSDTESGYLFDDRSSQQSGEPEELLNDDQFVTSKHELIFRV
ncbi:unnamed protein product [Dicrocoelium dendriticum]|nr:unnamed protein product [Dicrocoelium dendriticum]